MFPVLATRWQHPLSLYEGVPFNGLNDLIDRVKAFVRFLLLSLAGCCRWLFRSCLEEAPAPALDLAQAREPEKRPLFKDIKSLQGLSALQLQARFCSAMQDNQNLLQHAIRFHLGKIPAEQRGDFITQLDQSDGGALLECTVTALKMVFFSRDLSVQKDSLPGYLVKPSLGFHFIGHTTVDELIHLQIYLFGDDDQTIAQRNAEGNENACINALTRDERLLLIHLSGRDAQTKTPAYRRAPEQVQAILSGLVKIAKHLSDPSDPLALEFARLLQINP